MKVLRKFLCLVLCLSLSTYTIPVLAAGSVQSEEVVKIELSDGEMQKVVGGSGSVDAVMSEYIKYDPNQRPIAQATVTNRSNISVPYVLEVMDYQGVTLEELASGTLVPGESKVISGVATGANISSVRVKVGGNIAGLTAIDTAWLTQRR